MHDQEAMAAFLNTYGYHLLSSPNSGGALYSRVGVSDKRMGDPDNLILPAVG